MKPSNCEWIKALPEAMAIFSPDGALIATNQAFAKLVGIPAPDLPGRQLRRLFQGDGDALEHYFRLCRSTSAPVPGRVQVASGGGTRSYRCQGALLRSGDGRPCVWLRLTPQNEAVVQFALLNEQIAALGKEITSRQRSEAEAREAHQRLAFLAQATAVLSSSLDYEATLATVARLAVPRFADWSSIHLREEDGTLRELETYHPDPAKRQLAREWRRRYPPRPDAPYGAPRVMRTGSTEVMHEIPDWVLAQAAADEEQLRRLRALGLKSYICVPLRARQRVLGALTLITAESERRYSSGDIELLEDLAGRCAAAIDQARLFTDAVRASSLLNAVLRHMPVGVVIAEAPTGKIIFNSHPEMMGKDFEPVDSVRQFARLAPMFPDLPPEQFPLVRALRGETIRDMDIRFLRTDGSTRVMRTSSTPVFDGTGNLIAAVSVYEDVTEKLAAEDALRRSEKLAAAGRLAATVAHEINNPLEAVTNLLYLAKTASDGEVRQYLDMAEHELSRVGHMAKQTLGFYRDTTAPNYLQLGVLVEEVVDLYARPAQAKQVSIAIEIRGEVWVHACGGEVKQIVSNLLANAIDACRPGGHIRVRLHAHGGRARITVADNGTGIARKDLRKIWEPFFTTKQQVGTGLGLWVTKDMVIKNGGRISVRSRQDHTATGAVFTVSFPVCQSGEQTTAIAV